MSNEASPISVAQQDALLWIIAYAAQLSSYDEDGEYESIDADDLIDTAKTHIEPSDWGGDYLVRGGLLEGVSTDPVFWDKLSIYLNQEIPEDVRGGFFSCSC